MSEPNELMKGYDTKAIHGGHEFDPNSSMHSELVPSIVTSMTFYQPDPTNITGYCYCRAGNPSQDSLKRCLAALDNGKHCLVFPSGCAAASAVLLMLKAGDHIVSSCETYGGTRTQFLHYTKIQGIEIDFVDSTDMKLIESAIKSNTRLIWIETPSNPCLKISDITAIAKLAHSRDGANIMLAVDNTLLTSYFQRPLDLGADLVVYSLTKYMNGHNDVLAGAIIVNDKQIYEELDFIQTKYGFISSPYDCYLMLRGLRTLPLRMKQHAENGIAVARYLETHPKVMKVFHPGLPSHPQHGLAKKQNLQHCGMVAIQLSGTINETKKFVQSLRIFLSSGSLGSYGSLALIPAFASHINMPKELREKLGIFDTTVRLSVGLENIDDLIKDLEQALDKAFA